MVFKFFNQPQALLGLLAFQLDIILGKIADVGVSNFNVILFESFEHRFVIFGSGNNLKIAAIISDVFSPRIQGNFQQLFFVHFVFFNINITLPLKHPGNATGLTHSTA